MPEQAFIDIVRKHLKYLRAEQPLDVDRSLRTMGLDSMASVELLLDIEDTYGIALSQKHLINATARTVWGHIEEIRPQDLSRS